MSENRELAAIHEDAVFYYQPNGAYRGCDEIDRIAGRDQGHST
ncbi:hypothetical protein [Mesorhizobium sp. AR02]|nr:hypothetical protein [Mesorhizobium sp. AR02]